MGILKRNRKKSLGIGLADHGRQSPRHTEEQDTPAAERPTRLDEEAGTAVHEMKNPPKAEGDRPDERSE